MIDLEFEDYFLHLKENKLEATFLVNEPGLILICNEKAAHLFAYNNPREICGLHVKQLVPDDFAELFPKRITAEHLTLGEFLPRVNKKKNGENFATWVSTNFVYISNKKYILTIVRDRSDEAKGTACIETAKLKQNIEVLKCELKKEKYLTALPLENGDFLDTEINLELRNKLANIHKGLNQNDYKLASLLFLHLDSKTISQVLNIGVNSVYMARKRLRKKLNLPKDKTLLEYLLEIMK